MPHFADMMECIPSWGLSWGQAAALLPYPASAREVTVCDKSPVLLCAAASGVFFVHQKITLCEQTHTLCDKSPVLLFVAASGVFFFTKKEHCLNKKHTFMTKALFFCARRPPAAFFHQKRALFKQKTHFYDKKPCSSLRGGLRRVFVHPNITFFVFIIKECQNLRNLWKPWS